MKQAEQLINNVQLLAEPPDLSTLTHSLWVRHCRIITQMKGMLCYFVVMYKGAFRDDNPVLVLLPFLLGDMIH